MVSLHLSAAGEGTLFREIYYACSTVEWTDWRQSRVLQGPTVQLTIGLTCTRETPTSVPTAAYLSTGFIRSGSALPMGTTTKPDLGLGLGSPQAYPSSAPVRRPAA